MTAQPYRDPPEPCPVCVAREDARATMLPFLDFDVVSCPECGRHRYTYWKTPCEGAGKSFWTRGKGWFSRLEVAFTCELEDPPKHFHFQCETCSSRWMMLAKSEMADAR